MYALRQILHHRFVIYTFLVRQPTEQDEPEMLDGDD